MGELCECKDWETENTMITLVTGHSTFCNNCTRELVFTSMTKIISELCNKMMIWGLQEDGIPEEAFDLYKRAVYISTGRVIED